MVSLLEEEEEEPNERWQGTEGAGSSEPPKAHPTSEFILVL